VGDRLNQSLEEGTNRPQTFHRFVVNRSRFEH